MIRAFPACALIAVLAAPAALRGVPPDTSLDPVVRTVLSRDLGFSAKDIADLQAGRFVRRSLDSNAAGEFGVAGATLVHAPKAAFFDTVRDIVRFKRGPQVTEIGRFSPVPVAEDLAGLTVTKEDFDPASCRPGDCGIRLPADLIARLPHDIEVKAPNAQAQAALWLKHILLADVIAYTTGSAGRLTQYDDGSAPIRPVEDFDAVLAHTPAIGSLLPELPEHLRRFPAFRLADAENFLYWSKENFGSAPFITVTHVTLVCPSTRTCVMATKDVYSSRYIDASLAVAVASDAGGAHDGFFLVYANRSRVHALKGLFGGMRRSIVERRARGGLEESLKTIKAQLEAAR